MILFLNVGLFDQRLGPIYNRDSAKNYDKVEVFKYSLSSYSKYYKWSKVIIYYQLGPEYAERDKEVYDYIVNEFKEYNLIVKNSRNHTPAEWRETFNLFDDNLILYNCNHDHVFIDPDPSYFSKIVDDFKNSEELISIAWSHWPENLANVWSNTQYHLQAQDIEFHDKYISYKIDCDINSLSVITKSLYYYWWFTHDLPERSFFRPDHFTDPIWHYGQFENHTKIVPYRELGRHFDAYQHCPWKYQNIYSAVLEIPEGFFDNNIKINYSSVYLEGKTNINPLNENLKLFSDHGSDFNMHKKFLPLFWTNRISYFKDDFNYFDQRTSDETLLNAYKQRVLNTWSGLPCEDKDIYDRLQIKIKEYLDLI